MIRYVKGNLLESDAMALVNTVNTVGVMGKGIALQFKKAFPNNFKVYKEKCKNEELKIGDILVVVDKNLVTGEKLIINFPTKTSWRKPSEYKYIEKGLDALVKVIDEHNITSIAIPPLGSGNGGLHWSKVKQLLENKLSHIDAEIIIYEPNNKIKETLRKERVKLTPARAMLVYMLFQLVRNGEFVSEFTSEKICYFLQRFGAQKYFKLDYQQYFYGPYSGKVKHVLYYLNGSYLMGYSGKDKKPFEAIDLVMDTEKDVLSYLENNQELKTIVQKTQTFLEGFYSDFALELLSSVDFIVQSKAISDKDTIIKELKNWNTRKKTMFANDRYIDISLEQLRKAGLMN